MSTIGAVLTLTAALGVLYGFIAVMARPGSKTRRRRLSDYYTITGRRRPRPLRHIRPKRIDRLTMGGGVAEPIPDDGSSGDIGGVDGGGCGGGDGGGL